MSSFTFDLSSNNAIVVFIKVTLEIVNVEVEPSMQNGVQTKLFVDFPAKFKLVLERPRDAEFFWNGSRGSNGLLRHGSAESFAKLSSSLRKFSTILSDLSRKR